MTSATGSSAVMRPGFARASWVVCRQELRDLWLSGRGMPLLLAFSVLLSVTSYLVASNQALNFLEQREAVNLTLQMAVAVAGAFRTSTEDHPLPTTFGWWSAAGPAPAFGFAVPGAKGALSVVPGLA